MNATAEAAEMSGISVKALLLPTTWIGELVALGVKVEVKVPFVPVMLVLLGSPPTKLLQLVYCTSSISKLLLSGLEWN